MPGFINDEAMNELLGCVLPSALPGSGYSCQPEAVRQTGELSTPERMRVTSFACMMNNNTHGHICHHCSFCQGPISNKMILLLAKLLIPFLLLMAPRMLIASIFECFSKSGIQQV